MRRTGKAIGTLAAATSLALLTGGVAAADVADNDVSNSANGSKTIDKAGSVAVKYWIKATKDGAGAGDGGACNVSSGNPASVAISMPGGVNAVSGSTAAAGGTTKTLTLSFTACGDADTSAQTVTFSAPSNAVYGDNLITHAVSGGSPAVTKDNSTDFKLVFADITKPVTAALPNVADTTTGTSKSVSFTASATDNTGVSQVTCTAGTVSLNGGSLTTTDGVTSRTFSGSFPVGDTTVSCSSKDAANNNSLAQTFTVTISQIPSDSTPPVITPSVTGASGSNGWYVGDVDLTWGVTDPESAVSSTTGCGPVSVTTDQAATDYTCSASSGGGSHSETVSIKRDSNAPSVSYTSASGTPGSNGWYTSDVTATFTGTDALSGPASATQTQTSSGQGSAVAVSSPAFTDGAGNTRPAGAASHSFKIDKTAPANITFGTSGVQNGGSYLRNFVPAKPSCHADDATSGVASCVVSDTSNVAGTHTLTATATDNAGNTATATISYTVRTLTISAFKSPVDGSGVLNVVKGGNTVPLKFTVHDGTTELTNTSVVSGFASAWVTCTNTATDEVEEFSTAGSTSLRYDSGQFIQNWKTPTGAGKCLKAVVTTVDGSTQTALFKLK